MSLCVTLGIKLAVKNHNLPFDFSVSINPNINIKKKNIIIGQIFLFSSHQDSFQNYIWIDRKHGRI